MIWASKCLLCLSVILFLPLLGAQTIGYIYDQNGRLAGVIGASGNAAAYKYDAVGNIVSIARFTSAQVSIINFTPINGSIGTSVTISGTGFSATPSQNTVKFNGVQATVASSTVNQIVASVPSGATTGAIQVTTPNGSATSDTPFTVTTSTGAPTITSFTPSIGTTGSALTINGTNFDTNTIYDRVKINDTFILPSSLTSTVINAAIPTTTTSGRISVSTRQGQATSSADLYIPPQSYQVSDIAFTQRLQLPGEQQAVPFTTNKINLLIFDCSVGHRFSVKISQITMPYQNTLWAYDPIATQLYQQSFGGSSYFFQAVPCRINGTHELATWSQIGGTATVDLYDVPPDQTGSIDLLGDPVNVNITQPGQKASLTFNGTNGQQVVVWAQNIVNIPYGDLRLLDPFNVQVADKGFGNQSAIFMDKQTLAQTGTYTIKVDPQDDETGTMTLKAFNVIDQTGPITLSGPSVNVNLATPGQNADFTFTGTAGQKVSAYGQNNTIPSGHLFLLDPNNNQIADSYSNGSTVFMDAQTLPTNGTYTLQMNPDLWYTGSMTLNAYNVIDQTGTLTLNGSAQPVSLTTFGQNALFTFLGTAGQAIRAELTQNTIPGVNMYVLNPDGSLLTQGWTNVATLTIGATLPATGTYTVKVDPQVTNVGAAQVQVVSP